MTQKTTIKRLFGFIKPYLAIFIIAMVCLILFTIFSGFSIMTILPLVDGVLSGKKITFTTAVPFPGKEQFYEILNYLNGFDRIALLNIMMGFFFVVTCLKLVFDYIQQVLMEYIGQNATRDVRVLIYAKIQYLSMDYFSKERVGVLMARITNDVNILLELLSGRFASSLKDAMQILLYTTIIVVIDYKLALVALVILPVVAYPVLKVGKRLRKLSKQSQETIGDLNSILQETFSGIRVVQAFSMEEYEISRFRQIANHFAKIMIKAAKREAFLGPLTEIAGITLALFVVYYCSRRVLGGAMSLGQFILFLGALVSMVKPLKVIAKLNVTIQKGMAAGERVFEVLDAKSSVVEKENPIELETLKNEIAFKDISFSYKKGEAVLSDIDFSVKRGQIIAFVGSSGVGKTTLVNLLPRFYDVTKGAISIDGCDIRDLSIESLRKNIGIVTQETILFNDTIKNNIAYGHIETSFDKLVETTKIANAHNFIMNLPDQYDTVIGDRGARLSGGEKQRITIARAILKNPAILILDEATSALDTESERLVQEALDKLMEHRTVLVIAHRLSTIQHADTIIALDDGTIAEMGRHDELITHAGVYKKFYDLQFSNVNKDNVK
ncbi:MAG: ABC transporter ATP-binding protein [Candidatus Ancaeobacter aquaticus]|nr:ABC transporter ATP-binding protein [Candidatus Ancaeobacter aquaticus]